jgi:hypothetical protein
MLVLDGAFFYALMAAEFQGMPTFRPDIDLAPMREENA